MDSRGDCPSRFSHNSSSSLGEVMSAEMKKYPKIGQLKDARYEVVRRASYAGKDDEGNPIYKDPGKLPTLQFEGTVKLHGTNACIVYPGLGQHCTYQSRNRILTLEKDNAGFVAWCEDPERTPESILEYDPECNEGFLIETPDSFPHYVYGEFCGGNIQKGVGICELPKMFVTFDEPSLEGKDIYYIKDFQTWDMEIDFNDVNSVQNELIAITEQVEKECPVAKALGVDNGVGEGVVWKCVTPGWEHIWFKVKGQEHSKSKVNQLSPVDMEKLTKTQALASQIMTPGRCQQGLEYLTEMQIEHSRKNTGAYLKYVVADAMKEEAIAIQESGIEPKQLGKYVSQVAKDWFFQQV